MLESVTRYWKTKKTVDEKRNYVDIEIDGERGGRRAKTSSLPAFLT